MFIKVKLLEGYTKPLFYEVPKDLNDIPENTLVKVPIRTRTSPAIVLETYKSLPQEVDFKVLPMLSVEPFPNDSLYHKLITQVSKLYLTSRIHFYQRIRQFLKFKGTMPTEQPNTKTTLKQVITLTNEQQIVVDHLAPIIQQPRYAPILLHGVTGSGKTEVYIDLMLKTLKQNLTIIFLLPEVSLSLQFQELLARKMPLNTPIYGFHSASKVTEKKILWKRLVNNQPTIILGVHLPILLPISNLGLIIVDEEHEINYQEKKHPKINSKEIAILRASMCNIPILLGSATPSLNSLYNVKKRNWKFFQIKKRFLGNFPTIQKVMLSKEKGRQNFWISIPLKKAIQETIDKKEQVLIFLNRRGHSSFLLCKDCGFIFECPHCSVSLTLHIHTNNEILKCHYCNYIKNVPKTCPECKTDKLIKRGIGTQQMVSILEKMFPHARIKRADIDTTSKKRQWSETVKLCEEGKVDILVGTQSITKGYHFPKVTLVGVIWADMSLHFPMFNASEVTMQQLLQVSGRAGRESKHSKVIMQVIHDHHIFNHMSETNYLKFYEDEISSREMVNYPPICRLLYIELRNNNPLILDTEAERLYKLLDEKKEADITLLGPVKPTIFRIQKSEIRHIFIKTKHIKRAFALIHTIDKNTFQSSIYIVPS